MCHFRLWIISMAVLCRVLSIYFPSFSFSRQYCRGNDDRRKRIRAGRNGKLSRDWLLLVLLVVVRWWLIEENVCNQRSLSTMSFTSRLMPLKAKHTYTMYIFVYACNRLGFRTSTHTGMQACRHEKNDIKLVFVCIWEFVRPIWKSCLSVVCATQKKEQEIMMPSLKIWLWAPHKNNFLFDQ